MLNPTVDLALHSRLTQRLALVLFGVSIFVSAALLFSVQPVVAKLLLPLLGGVPAVWNTCLLFFQVMLMLGYFYVFMISRLRLQIQLALQLSLLALGMMTLPLQIAPSWSNSVPATGNPTFWLLTCLTVMIGLPFFIISSNGPLLQKWFSATGLTSGRDPYFLYSISNAGSLLALLAYPVLLERQLTVQVQTQVWSVGYTVLVLLVAVCSMALWRLRLKYPVTPIYDSTNNAAISNAAAADSTTLGQQRARWILLAFVPSSLMYGVTNYISTDIASVPLLWIIPLALYLGTWIVAFGPTRVFSSSLPAHILKFATLILLAFYLTDRFSNSSWLPVIHLVYFFFAALIFHSQLAATRPATDRLPEFYLWLCLGGVLGGVFNSLIAPQIFSSVMEYPLVMALGFLLLPSAREDKKSLVALDVMLPVSMLLLTLALGFLIQRVSIFKSYSFLIIVWVPLAVSYFLPQRPWGLVLTIYAIMLGSGLFSTMNKRTLYLSRNFFGTLRVVRESDTQIGLMHGTTTHGRQSTNPDLHCEPLSYYHRKGPLGSVFATFHALPNSTNVAIVGLGVGTTAAYARPNERWTFYEINPSVVELARNSEYFSYLRDCAQAPVDVVLGDARLQLRNAPNAHYGLIVIDAFTSDSIPVHLLTQEAVDLYLSKLAAGGLLAFHISNRHLDLGPVLDGIARSRNLTAVDINDDSFKDFAGKDMSRWIVLTRSLSDQGSLPDLPTAKILNGAGGSVWTDSFSNIVSVFDWH